MSVGRSGAVRQPGSAGRQLSDTARFPSLPTAPFRVLDSAPEAAPRAHSHKLESEPESEHELRNRNLQISAMGDQRSSGRETSAFFTTSVNQTGDGRSASKVLGALTGNDGRGLSIGGRRNLIQQRMSKGNTQPHSHTELAPPLSKMKSEPYDTRFLEPGLGHRAPGTFDRSNQRPLQGSGDNREYPTDNTSRAHPSLRQGEYIGDRAEQISSQGRSRGITDRQPDQRDRPSRWGTGPQDSRSPRQRSRSPPGRRERPVEGDRGRGQEIHCEGLGSGMSTNGAPARFPNSYPPGAGHLPDGWETEARALFEQRGAQDGRHLAQGMGPHSSATGFSRGESSQGSHPRDGHGKPSTPYVFPVESPTRTVVLL